jgi:plastocyanin
MRRPLFAIALLAVALAAGACSASAPGWTYAPPTPTPAVTPAPSGAATAAPAGPTPAVTLAPSDAAPSAGSAGLTTVDISALNVMYEQTEISVPANADFVIRFDNKDVATQHNVEIRDASGSTVFKGDLITGPAQIEYKVKALPAGTYQFMCSVHMNMVGTLTVGS